MQGSSTVAAGLSAAAVLQPWWAAGGYPALNTAAALHAAKAGQHQDGPEPLLTVATQLLLLVSTAARTHYDLVPQSLTLPAAATAVVAVTAYFAAVAVPELSFLLLSWQLLAGFSFVPQLLSPHTDLASPARC